MKHALGGLVLLALWMVLAFVLDLRTGWVHVPLGGAVALFTAAVVVSDDRASPDKPPRS